MGDLPSTTVYKTGTRSMNDHDPRWEFNHNLETFTVSELESLYRNPLSLNMMVIDIKNRGKRHFHAHLQ